MLERLFSNGQCCVCAIANCASPVGFDVYSKMTLNGINEHLETRELLATDDTNEGISDE